MIGCPLTPNGGNEKARTHNLRLPITSMAAVLPTATGEGGILFIQLDLQSRVDRSKPNYDPVAERILINLLGQGSF